MTDKTWFKDKLLLKIVSILISSLLQLYNIYIEAHSLRINKIYVFICIHYVYRQYLLEHN